MEDETIIAWVQQWMHEKGFFESLKSLESESGEVYNDRSQPMAAQLLNALQEHHELQIACQAGTSGKSEFESELCQPGDGRFAQKLTKTVEGIHSRGIIAMCFSNDVASSLAFTGSSDKTIKAWNLDTGLVENEFLMHQAAILCLSAHPSIYHLLLSSSMDATHALSDTRSFSVLEHFKLHTKYVVKILWSPDGSRFATASHDGTVCVHSFAEDALVAEGDAARYKTALLKQYDMRSVVETIAFTGDSSELFASVRDSCHLRRINIGTTEIKLENMNSNGDEHVSFCVLALSLSPCRRFLLGSTDRNRVIMWHVDTFQQVRNFWGVNNDSFSQPQHCWDPSGRYIYGTSQDYRICVWEVATAKIVGQVLGHHNVVRSLAFHSSRMLLGSCSFDGTVKLFAASED